jgi:hypothetical protein
MLVVTKFGNFSTASCNFVDEKTLFISWHNTLIMQTFKMVNSYKIILRMENPNSKGEYELIMEVLQRLNLLKFSAI